MSLGLQASSRTPSRPATYWLTRFVIVRLLGVLYAVAFLVAINQLVPLMGADGLLPVGIYMDRWTDAVGTAAAFMKLPSVFWFGHSDTALRAVSWIGLALACIVAAGYANAIVLAVLWFLYMSIVHVGQEWYGYGWEIQLLETGFLAIFLCPLLDLRPFPKRAPPTAVLYLFRWLIFRIMTGSALIKLRGDEIWRHGTALYYHFETQPLPGPFSRWFHFLPHAVLKAGVGFNFLAELIAPWFAFTPGWGRRTAGAVMVLFQLSIILSGNLSFLNWLTIVPALACFDDGVWQKLLPRRLTRKAEAAAAGAAPSRPMLAAAWVVTAVVALLSVQPVLNLISPRQIMNTSFDALDLVNTYGAFGTVGRERLNVVFEGTADDDSTEDANWKPYIYRGLPVRLDERPPQIAPYQLHLDWQMWFASMSSPARYPWTVNLIWKLLHNDPKTAGLFAENPFADKPPKYIRAVLYRYRFAEPGNAKGLYWTREKAAAWLPPLSVDNPQLIMFLESEGWIQ